MIRSVSTPGRRSRRGGVTMVVREKRIGDCSEPPRRRGRVLRRRRRSAPEGLGSDEKAGTGRGLSRLARPGLRAGAGRVRRAPDGGFRGARARGAAGLRRMVPGRIWFAARPGLAAWVHADTEDGLTGSNCAQVSNSCDQRLASSQCAELVTVGSSRPPGGNIAMSDLALGGKGRTKCATHSTRGAAVC